MSTAIQKKTCHEWTNSELNQLIHIYKNMPELWHQMAAEYRDKQAKLSCYRKIAKTFKTSIIEIRRKIHNLRCQFSSEIRKLKYKAMLQNVHVSEVKSNWRYFQKLSFLLVNYKEFQKDGDDSIDLYSGDHKDYTNTSESLSTIEFLKHIDSDDEKSNDEKSNDEKSCDTLCKPSTSQKFVPKSEEVYLNAEDEYIIPVKRKVSDDDHRIFGEYVASELRNISHKGAMKLKMKIRKAILEVMEEEFNLENGDEY